MLLRSTPVAATLSVFMKCVHCQEDIDIQLVLETSEFSWPLKQTVWYVCTHCNQGNHIRFENCKILMVKYLGAPGYEYDTIQEISAPSIEIRIDPAYLHVWFHGKHFEVKERAYQNT